MVFMIGAAQRRFLVFASTIFFVSSLYICISRLMAPTFEPVTVHPKQPEIHVEFSKADLPMSYGNFARPGYDGINLMAQFPDELIPTRENGRRLIVVGDIHGMLDSLNELLKRTNFDPTRDHLISVGDTVNKGPKSAEVVQRLMELGASAVRGNHEDRVLVAWAGLTEQQGVEAYLDSDFAAAQRGESLDLKTARSLSETQIQWLKNLPVILTIEPMSLYIVHAGLVPGVPLPNQDPWAVMNMRSMRFPRAEFREEEETKRRKAEEKKKKEEEKKKQEEEEKKKKAKVTKSTTSASTSTFTIKAQSTAGTLPAIDAHTDAHADSHADSPANSHADSRADSHIESHTDSHIGISGSAAPESSPELDLLSQPDHDIWIPVDSRSGEPWANIWNHVQKKIPSSQRRSIIYGHDAKRGFREDSYTFGLDSGCVKGNAMTALIIEAESGGWNQTTVQVNCKEPKRTNANWWQ
ncbi:Metallo-dependent phosphatase-like protein [Ilyonectria sp. MPI-CAGE-AT-0026]|nr:Metallo-dependent phosphatase-like protein [Ilyonectria sp. MPI-CAGE-AT-0026]